MNFALGVLLVWLGAAMMFVAMHGADGSDLWGLYRNFTDRLSGKAGAS